jgi:hypothetical protein
MSQGISATLSLIKSRLEAISPKTDAHQNFVVIGDRSGLTAQLDQRNGSTRICEIEITGYPADAGETGITGLRTAQAQINVRYDVPFQVGYLQTMMSEDQNSIIVSLRQPDYDSVNTGLKNIIVSQGIAQPILDDTGEPVAYLLTIPLQLLFKES